MLCATIKLYAIGYCQDWLCAHAAEATIPEPHAAASSEHARLSAAPSTEQQQAASLEVVADFVPDRTPKAAPQLT